MGALVGAIRPEDADVSGVVRMRTATYVYCLIAASRRPVLKRARRGLPGTGPVRLLEVAEESDPRRPRPRGKSAAGALKRWLAVSDAPLRLYGEDVINRRLSDLDWISRAAVAHEAVVESFIEQPAVLPMKLFTIFINDDRALAHVRGERRRIAAALDRVAGHHEWGVRVMLDADVARMPRAASGTRERRPVSSGAGYLTAKKAQRDHAIELAGHAQQIVAGLYDRLDRLAARSKRRAASELPAGPGALLLDAAFLVPRERSGRFTKTMARETGALAHPGYRVTLSGPWPPYSFVEE
jgi:Gas vesicle synthesis protein GvpL/GvpF